MNKLMSVLGIFVLLFICYLFSANRKKIDWRIVASGMLLQLIIALLVLGVPSYNIPGVLRFLFDGINAMFVNIISFTSAGSKFLFGDLAGVQANGGIIFAFSVLPSILFFSGLMSILYYYGIMQKIVGALANIMQKTLKVSAAEALTTAANIFLGQTEAPLVVRPYIAAMTQSELLLLMVGGMASVAGGVLIAFVEMLHRFVPDIGGHLLTASIMSAPAAIVASKILYPETGEPQTLGKKNLQIDEIKDANVLEATARGSSEGLMLAMNVGAMLLVFIALMSMFNSIIGAFGDWISFSTWGAQYVPDVLLKGAEARLSLELIFGWLFAPFAFLLGIPWHESTAVGALLGEKIILNEFVAYLHLAQIGDQLSERSIIIASYALCGFANFSSIGIQIGGIGSLAPSRRSDLARFGLKAVLGGTIASFLTGCLVGILI